MRAAVLLARHPRDIQTLCPTPISLTESARSGFPEYRTLRLKMAWKGRSDCAARMLVSFNVRSFSFLIFVLSLSIQFIFVYLTLC